MAPVKGRKQQTAKDKGRKAKAVSKGKSRPASRVRDSGAREPDSAPDKKLEAAETTKLKKVAFLAAFGSCGRITKASEAAGINPDTHYEWRKTDPEYDAEFAALRERVADVLEEEAMRRAVEGETEPIIGRVARDQDGIITTVQKRSDKLLEILLKANRPEKFRERLDVTGKDGGPLAIRDLTGLSDDDIDAELASLEAEEARLTQGKGK